LKKPPRLFHGLPGLFILPGMFFLLRPRLFLFRWQVPLRALDQAVDMRIEGRAHSGPGFVEGGVGAISAPSAFAARLNHCSQ
jgi:hypothetical protein